MTTIFPVLECENIILKKVVEKDLTPLKEIISQMSPPPTDEEALALLVKLDQDFENGSGVSWGIYQQEELIGTCGYYRGFAENSGEIGFVMRPSFRRKGLMSEALKRIINYGFSKLNLKKVTAYTQPDNNKTIALLTKLGFKNHGRTSADYVFFDMNRPSG